MSTDSPATDEPEQLDLFKAEGEQWVVETMRVLTDPEVITRLEKLKPIFDRVKSECQKQATNDLSDVNGETGPSSERRPAA